MTPSTWSREGYGAARSPLCLLLPPPGMGCRRSLWRWEGLLLWGAGSRFSATTGSASFRSCLLTTSCKRLWIGLFFPIYHPHLIELLKEAASWSRGWRKGVVQRSFAATGCTQISVGKAMGSVPPPEGASGFCSLEAVKGWISRELEKETDMDWTRSPCRPSSYRCWHVFIYKSGSHWLHKEQWR